MSRTGSGSNQPEFAGSGRGPGLPAPPRVSTLVFLLGPGWSPDVLSGPSAGSGVSGPRLGATQIRTTTSTWEGGEAQPLVDS